jgi:protein SCO1/2
MPDFTLMNQHNQAISLSDLRGKVTLLAFGFTHCPDVCPLTLGEFRAIQTQLGDSAGNVNFVFMSVDGSRDTPDVLARYLETQRVPDFIALTGEEAYIQEIGTDYGLYFQANEADSNGNYSVDHTAGSFLFDEKGRWVMSYAYGIDRNIIVSDIQAFLAD